MPNSGQIIKAQDFAGFATDTEITSGTTTSTSFTATLTGGTACEVTFTAPTSGRVEILMSCQMSNDTGTNSCEVGFRVGTGSTPGGGTEVLAASELRAMKYESVANNDVHAASYRWTVTGLTAGTVYNIQQQYRVSGGTGTFSRKQLTVVPIP